MWYYAFNGGYDQLMIRHQRAATNDLSLSHPGTMIMSLSWNDNTNMLAALADGKFTVWYYPSAIYVDRDLMPKTIFEKEARYA